ncbi:MULTISPECIES: competence protein CoiA [unclassified Cryobacterium]|uniref:competence protein CoiA n=1 Tax=unclassified Cryobacterium TaxID=2649013 RepID=UPI0018C95253|nr:competence protein CoiA family protein [Cryobacterium sp. CAN_C3]
MPLVAHYKDQRVEAWRLNHVEWVALKQGYRDAGVAMVCGEPGYPKTSPNGLQFFAHKSADCTRHEGGPESPEHLQTKALIAAAGEAHGFEAIVESPADDRSFIIDVLLVRGSRRIAVEAQWSKQSDAEVSRRNARYTAVGLEVLWLVGPRNRESVNDVRAEHLNGTVDNITIDLALDLAESRTTLPLAHGLDLLFSQVLAPKLEPVVTSAYVATAMAKCWSEECGKWISYWYVVDVDIETRCGQTAAVWLDDYEPWLPERVEERLQASIIAQITASGLPKPTYFEKRYSKVVETYYIAQNCGYCGLVQGDGHIAQDRKWTGYRVPVSGRAKLPAPAFSAQHLCRDAGRGACDPEQNEVLAQPKEPSWRRFGLSSTEDREYEAVLPAKGERRSKR